jgi:hypothetical protein
MAEREFEHVVGQGRAVQRLFPDLGLIAVGGTAAALHCRHRVSLDVDEVTPRLQDRYAEVRSLLESWDGWSTNRLSPPLLILGQRYGVELGLRQQRRSVPLETVVVDGLVIPTPAEILRVKAFLLAERRATRDYVDVAALAEHLGAAASTQALNSLNLLYSSSTPQTILSRFAEACESDPVDQGATPLSSYKCLKAPFTDWSFVATTCQRLGRALLKLELQGGLPSSLANDVNREPHS